MNPTHAMRRVVALAIAAAMTTGAPSARATDPAPDDPAQLKHQLEELARQNAALQKQLEELQRRVDALAEQKQAAPAPAPATSTMSPQQALDAAVTETQSPAPAQGAAGASPGIQPAQTDLASYKMGSATLRLIDLSLVTDVAAGWSSEDDGSILTLQGGDHDPRRRGFTLQAAELSLAGAVDPYFTAQANINFNIDPPSGDTNVELEEAFATTQSLPFGLQVKGGQYFTEFGLLNPTHPHTWDWMDQPVVLTRFFGGDGMRGVGGRVGWLTPLPWYSQVIAGVQNSNGETMASFFANEEFVDDRGVGNRPFVTDDVSNLGDLTYSARWENSFDITPDVTLKVGASGAFGPNSTGDDERTRIYGGDFKLKWKPGHAERGWPFVIWQGEIIARDYEAGAYFNDSDPTNVISLSQTTFHDWGLYTQVLYGFTPGWAAGLRYEYDTGSGDSVGGRENDPFRDDRQRISPLLEWNISEFTRLRLQYNHDIADHLDEGSADSLYIGFEVLFGAHPAHAY